MFKGRQTLNRSANVENPELRVTDFAPLYLMSYFNLNLTTTRPASVLCAALRPTRLKAPCSLTRTRLIHTSTPWLVLFSAPGRSRVPPSQFSTSELETGWWQEGQCSDQVQSGEEGREGRGADIRGRGKKFAQGSFCVPGESLGGPRTTLSSCVARGTHWVLDKCLRHFKWRLQY